MSARPITPRPILLPLNGGLFLLFEGVAAFVPRKHVVEEADAVASGFFQEAISSFAFCV